MTANPMITKDYLHKIHLYSYEDVQEFIEINRTLEREMEKPAEEMDVELVEECLAYIDLVMSEEHKTDEATLDAKYQQAVAALAEKNAEKPCKVLHSKKRGKRKVFFILAAAISVLISSLTIAAKVYGYKNAWEFIYQKAIEIMDLDTGETIEENESMAVRNEQTEVYDSFEELIEAENLDIFYPHSPPNGLEINNIQKVQAEDNRIKYVIDLNADNTSIVISNHYSVNIVDKTYADTYTVANKQFYIDVYTNGTYQAICHYDKYEYKITAYDYDTLIDLLEAMKGNES